LWWGVETINKGSEVEIRPKSLSGKAGFLKLEKIAEDESSSVAMFD